MANVTMSDVAKRVGVSRASVSYALNGLARKRGVSKSLERKIFRAAEEMGYRPSRLAQSLVSQRTHTLGLILPDLGASYGPVLAESLETEARRQGYQVLLAHHGNDLDRFKDALATMLGWHIDGLAIVPLVGSGQQAAMKQLESLDVPTVLLERDIADGHAHVVTCDVAHATRMAMNHLLELGHRRIALLDAPRELLESHTREHTYEECLNKAGVAVDPSLIYTPPLKATPAEQTEDMAEQLFAADPKPTAAVVVSGERAIALYKACEARGLVIPRDLSVVVITGMQFDSFSRMQFTCARLTYGEMGKAAFQLLLHDIEQGRTNARRMLTSPQWIEGQSTAPIPGEK